MPPRSDHFDCSPGARKAAIYSAGVPDRARLLPLRNPVFGEPLGSTGSDKETFCAYHRGEVVVDALTAGHGGQRFAKPIKV